MIGSKRDRSALSPTRPESPLPPEFSGRTMWETEKSTVGAQKLHQNPNLATAPDMDKEGPNCSSIMVIGLPTSEPAERSSGMGFGEFLQACRWCKKKIEEDSNVYMYGYLGAFCTPECREILIKLDSFLEKRYSRSGQAEKRAEHAKQN